MRALVVCALSLAAACSSHRPDGRGRMTDRSPEVARVNGEVVTAREVAIIAQAEGLAPRDALDRAIRDRLLAREGARRGVIAGDDVENATWHASVQLLLAREVERRESPATIPPAFFEALYQHRRVELSHDGLVAVVHALARTDGDAGVGARVAARALLAHFYETLTATAGPRPTREQFEALARQTQGLRVEALPNFDRTGQAADGTRLAEPFVNAAWALTEAGPLSPPVETSFGVHVILLTGTVPPLVRSPDEVRTLIVRDGINMRRAAALTRLVTLLRARADVRVNEAALGAQSAHAPTDVAAPEQ